MLIVASADSARIIGEGYIFKRRYTMFPNINLHSDGSENKSAAAAAAASTATV